MLVQRVLMGLVGVSVMAAWGCAANGSTTGESDLKTSKAHLLALSNYSASLGTPIEAYMANPPPADARSIELVFDGTFKRRDGKEERVSITQPTSRVDAGAVRWNSFGPFKNPFTPKDPDIGVFTGKVGVKVTLADGTSTTDEAPIPVRFEVRPSIIVTELQPKSADCSAPALKLIGGMSYTMKAAMLGFDATSVDYEIKTPGMVPDSTGQYILDVGSDGAPKYKSTLISHKVKSAPVDDSGDPTLAGPATDSVDGVTLPHVPTDRPSYGVVISITARNADGGTVRSTFGMTAHNPLEVYYDGRYQLAQIYPAKPVSGCMPGGQQGRSVDYIEAKSETRSRSLSVTLSSTWLKSDENNWSTSDGKTVTTGKTVTDGYSNTHADTNSFNFEKNRSDANGVSFNWSSSNEVGGTANISFKPFGLGADAGGSYKRGWQNGSSKSSTSYDGWSQSSGTSATDSATADHSSATTDSTAVTQTDSKGGSQSNQAGGGEAVSDAWTVSSTDTIQRGFGGEVVANTYGVFYRQLARYTERAFVLELNKCGEGTVVGEVTMQDYVWAPDLALGEACPPLPNSNFPAAQCYLPPCDPQ